MKIVKNLPTSKKCRNQRYFPALSSLFLEIYHSCKKKSLQTLPLDCSKDWETEITALCEPDMGTRALLEPGTQLTCIWESSLTSILRAKCKSKWETETGCRRWSFPGWFCVVNENRGSAGNVKEKGNMKKYARNNSWSWWFYGRVLMIGRNPNPNCGNFFLGPNKKRLDSSSHAIRLTICTMRCWMTEDLDCKYRQI